MVLTGGKHIKNDCTRHSEYHDYVVVKGVTDKGKIHIIDPTYAVNDVANMPMTSFTVMHLNHFNRHFMRLIQ